MHKHVKIVVCYIIYYHKIYTIIYSRLLVIQLWGSQKLYLDFRLHSVGTPDPLGVQGSTALGTE